MSMLVIMDGDRKTGLSEGLREKISQLAARRGIDVDQVELHRGDIPPCIGCLTCITKHPGRCINQSALEELTAMAAQKLVVIFLTPVVFGTCGAAIKCVMERGGLIVRNHAECLQLVVGYGDDATAEEISTFLDITRRHLGSADIVHPIFSRDRIETFFIGGAADVDAVLRVMEENAA